MTTITFQDNWKNFATFAIKGNTKIPATKNGFKDAKFGHDVQKLIMQGNNIGLACAMSNLIVIDCDVDEAKGYNGLQVLAEKENELGQLPKTLTQKTPRGGKHFIFSAKGITNPIGKIGKDIDIKSNGYVLISPSSINGKYYEIINGIDENGNFILAELPMAWLNYLNKSNPQEQAQTQKSELTLSVSRVYKDINIDKLFDNCKFLQYCRDNADTLSDPEWFSMVSILAQIEDSDELIHKLSEPYPKYNYAETQKKIDNARKFGHSQSCKYISDNYSDICKECTKNQGKDV